MTDNEDMLLFGPDSEGEEPTDLPEAKVVVFAKTPLEAASTCEKCGGPTRIVSNYEGRRAWCNKCGHNWGISLAAVSLVPGGLETRGLSKRTLVEPDWNLAYEDLDEIDGEDRKK